MTEPKPGDLKKHGIQADLLQDAVYRIVQASERAESLEDLLPRLHAIINEVMPAGNFYIALYDERADTIQFPYFVDEVDAPPPSGKQPFGRGLTEYVLRTGRSLLCDQALHEKLEREGKVELVGVPSPIWLGVPLTLDGRVIGAMVVQHYSNPGAYGEREKRMLEFVSGQIAASIGRRQKDDDIRESEARYRRLFEDSPVAIWEEDYSAVSAYLEGLRAGGVRDLKTHFAAHPEILARCAELVRVIDVNQATLKMYRASGKDAFFQNLAAVIPPEELHVFEEELLAIFQGPGWFEAQTHNYTLDGARLDIILRCTVVPGNEQGLSRVIVTITDISPLKQIESALRASEENFRSLFVNVPDGVYRTTPDGRILDANPALAHMLGYELPTDLLQRRVDEHYVIPGDRERFKTLLQRDGEARNVEVLLRRRDGRQLVCFDNSRAVRDGNGEVLYYEGVLTDVTELKRVEHSLQEKVITLELLAEIDRQILSATEVDAVMELVCANAAALLHTPKALIVSQLSGSDLRLNASYGLANPDWVQAEFKRAFPAGGIPNLSQLCQERGDAEGHFLKMIRARESVAAALCEPFVLDEEHGGVVMVFDIKPRDWTDSDIDLLRILTGQAAIALERTRLFAETRRRAEELRRRNEELDRLYRASASLISSISFDLVTLAQTIAQIVLSEFEQTNCSLFLRNEHEEALVRIASAGSHAALFAANRFELSGRGIVPRTARTGQVSLVNDVLSDPDYVAGWPEARAELAVPMIVKDRVIGVLDVQSSQAGAFTDQDRRLLDVFASRAALLLENAHLYSQTERRMQRLSALRAVDQAIASSLDLRITLNLLLEQITSQLSVDAAAVMLFNPALQQLQFAAGRGFNGTAVEHIPLRIGEGPAGQAAMDRAMVSLPNLASAALPSSYAERLSGERIMACFAAPLIAKGSLKGVLELFFRRPFEPDPEWPDFIETLSRQAAIAIEDAGLFESLQRTNTELAVAYDATIESWARALELRGKETPGHTQRVTELTLDLARAVGVDDARLVHVYRGALLHDIGLLVVPDAILEKTTRLDEADWLEIRKHPQHARDLLFSIVHLHPAIAIPYCHHERWDGSGYPRGLSGQQIPLEARVFSVVDSWVSMQTERAYRPARSGEEAIRHLREQAGRQYDPRVVEAFLGMVAGG